MLKINDESQRFYAASEEEPPRTAVKNVERVVFASLQASADYVGEGIQKLARAVDELHLRYGVTGFLCTCSVMQLAGKDAVRASMIGSSEADIQAMLATMSDRPNFAVFSFVQIADHAHLQDAQRWLASQGLSNGGDGSVGDRIG